MVTADDETCQLSSIPDGIQASAIEDIGPEVANRTDNITITKEEETIHYDLKLSNGNLTEDEKGIYNYQCLNN